MVPIDSQVWLCIKSSIVTLCGDKITVNLQDVKSADQNLQQQQEQKCRSIQWAAYTITMWLKTQTLHTASVPDNVHGLINDVWLVNAYDKFCSCSRGKHAENASAAANIKHNLVTKQLTILCNDITICTRPNLVLQKRDTSTACSFLGNSNNPAENFSSKLNINMQNVLDN